MTPAETLTPLVAFEATRAFQFRQNNVSATQRGRPGLYLTNSAPFARSVLANGAGPLRVVDGKVRLPCLPPARWAEESFRGRRVLFLLPSEALGSNVCTLLFLRAFRDHHKPRQMSVFCARSAADIYALDREIRCFELWLPREEVDRHDVLIDLGQLESRRDVDVWPVEMEAELLAAFALPPSRAYPPEARPLPGGRRPRIGVFPLASSPLRTLPVAVTETLCRALAPEGDVLLSLNDLQQQGRLYLERLGTLPETVRVTRGAESIGGLLRTLRGCDYAVFADSGPAHMSKLFATPGLAVYTAAPGEVLQGRFTNLARWTVDWEGPHCKAPCGLAKLRRTVDGAVGCMGSLGVPLAALPTTAQASDAAAVARLMDAPVPCVAALAEQRGALAAAVLADLAARRGM